MVFRDYKIIYFCVLVFMTIGQVNAACIREDVMFYLDKGFSHNQITTLCSESLVSEEKTLNNDAQSNEKVFVKINADDDDPGVYQVKKSPPHNITHETGKVDDPTHQHHH